MKNITSQMLQQFLLKDKRRFEGLFPELVKKLILNSCGDISNIRMPECDDIWAPGFDGVVISRENTAYFTEGNSIWEFGTNANSLRKINEDYSKRTGDSLGVDKSITTFYLVLPRIWAYDNQGMSIPKWESDHKKDGWRDVRIYDASVLCGWIDSEPAVCAWLLEQFGDCQYASFSSVEEAWRKFSNRTNPPFTPSMFLEGRDKEKLEFLDNCKNKMCRVRSTSFLDAYGFCLLSLRQNQDLLNRVIVVNDEATYIELTRFLKGKIFLLSFSFSGQVSDNNNTIICYSNESTKSSDMVELPTLWKTQFENALREMGLSDTQASECYAFTHGNLLSLIRRIPGNVAASRPKWADLPEIELLYPIVFMRQFCSKNELEKRVLAQISGVDYGYLQSKYESFLLTEDAPIKKIDANYFLVNYEEAWLTLQIDIFNPMSSRMHETVITLLTECKDADGEMEKTQAFIIQNLIYNYIYFAETGSECSEINHKVSDILQFSKFRGCKDIVLKSLPALAEASPDVTLRFIESELEHGLVAQAFMQENRRNSNYNYVIWALDKLVTYEDTAVQTCRILIRLCQIQREYLTTNSPKESLLNALCLWDNHSAVTIEGKKSITKKTVENDCSFGVPFAIELIRKTRVSRGIRIGKRERHFRPATGEELFQAYKDISSTILFTSIKERRTDWIAKALEAWRMIPSEVLLSSSELLRECCFSPVEKMPIVFQIKKYIYQIILGQHEQDRNWIQAFQKWIEYLTTEDPISEEGWRFYKFYDTPFPELIIKQREGYMNRRRMAEDIRKEVIIQLRYKYGKEGTMHLLHCMEDCQAWGLFLGANLVNEEYYDVANSAYSLGKIKLLSGLIDSVDMIVATELFHMLDQQVQERVLTLLHRNDIDEWMDSSDRQKLYWKNKRITEYTDTAYNHLIKYNPCGILPIFIDKENDPVYFDRLIDVVKAIVSCGNYSDVCLLTEIVQQFDTRHYSDEWAELCLKLYEQSVFKNSYGCYPNCLKVLFFRYPEKIIQKYKEDVSLFFNQFHLDYSLPANAYDDQIAFEVWTDYMYEKSKSGEIPVSVLGDILGKSTIGDDGIFPHEFVRFVLEKYSDDELTRDVFVGWLNSCGVRTVQDGLDEKKLEIRFRKFARELELEYPQTAKILSMIADNYRDEAKRDQLSSEMFPR